MPSGTSGSGKERSEDDLCRVCMEPMEDEHGHAHDQCHRDAMDGTHWYPDPRPCPGCDVRGSTTRDDDTLTRCRNDDCDVRLYRTRPGWSPDDDEEQEIRTDGGVDEPETEKWYNAQVHTRTLTSFVVGSGGCFLGGIIAQTDFLVGAFVAALAFAGALWYLPSAETVAIQYRAMVAADDRGGRDD